VHKGKKMKYGVVATLVIGLGLGACSTAQERMQEAGKEPLTKSEVREEIVGVTERGVAPSGSNYMVYRADNGQIRGKAWGNWGQETDIGTYTIAEDGLYCSKWQKWNNGKERCWHVYDEGDDIIYAGVTGGAEDFEIQKSNIVEGNPENL
jgi:hypothetical protein